MNAQGWGRGLLDVGDQALMRGFVPHVRVSSGAAPRLRTGVDASIGHLQSSEFPCRGFTPAAAQCLSHLSLSYPSFGGAGLVVALARRPRSWSHEPHEAAREARSQTAP